MAGDRQISNSNAGVRRPGYKARLTYGTFEQKSYATMLVQGKEGGDLDEPLLLNALLGDSREVGRH